MKKRKFRSGKFMLQTSMSQRSCFLAVLISVTFVCTIYVQGPMQDFKTSGLKLLISGTRSLLSLDNSSFANVNPLHSLFIIVPYRNRPENKKTFIDEMKKYLQKKGVQYRMVFVEQIGNDPFNKGILMNSAVKEITRIVIKELILQNASMIDFWNATADDFGVENINMTMAHLEKVRSLNDGICLIFHDVDMIPLNDEIPYSCDISPHHLASGAQQFNYSNPYFYFFGGVTAITLEHFLLVNGYPNRYWGWGGEDDDIYDRIKLKKLTPNQLNSSIGRYRSQSHKKHSVEESFKDAPSEVKKASQMTDSDGIRQLQYKLVNTTITEGITHLFVDVLYVKPITQATVATTTTTLATTTAKTTSFISNSNQNNTTMDVAVLQNIFGPNANEILNSETTKAPKTTTTTTTIPSEKITDLLSNLPHPQTLNSSIKLTYSEQKSNDFAKLVSSIDQLRATLESLMILVFIPILLVIVCCFLLLVFACHHQREIRRDPNPTLNSSTGSLSSLVKIRDI